MSATFLILTTPADLTSLLPLTYALLTSPTANIHLALPADHPPHPTLRNLHLHTLPLTRPPFFPPPSNSLLPSPPLTSTFSSLFRHQLLPLLPHLYTLALKLQPTLILCSDHLALIATAVAQRLASKCIILDRHMTAISYRFPCILNPSAIHTALSSIQTPKPNPPGQTHRESYRKVYKTLYSGPALRRLNKWRETHGLDLWDLDQTMHLWAGQMQHVWVFEALNEALVGPGWGGAVIPVGSIIDRSEGRHGWAGHWPTVRRFLSNPQPSSVWCVTRAFRRKRVTDKILSALRACAVENLLVFGEMGSTNGAAGGGGSLRQWKECNACVSTERVPVGWLYSRVGAVVCGGGRDEVLACMEMGVPCVVVGGGGADGAFWAQLPGALGVGVAVDDAAPQVEYMRAVHVVGGEECRRRARELAGRVREDGGGAERAAAKVREIAKRKSFELW